MTLTEAIQTVELNSFLDLDDKVINRIQVECWHKTPLNVAILDISKWAKEHKNPEVRFSVEKIKLFLKEISSGHSLVPLKFN
jgi:hypothetical protein